VASTRSVADAPRPHASAVGPRPAARGRAWRLAIVTAALYMTVDQVSKQIVIHSIGRGEYVRLIFGTRLANVHNQGVAFGAFAGHGIVVVILTLAALAALIVYFALRATTPLLWLPVGVVVGGALGNLADRARGGAVTDFIDVRIWPTFNLADAGIVLGILALLYMIEGARRAPTGSA
jgi:signal peptidase II